MNYLRAPPVVCQKQLIPVPGGDRTIRTRELLPTVHLFRSDVVSSPEPMNLSTTTVNLGWCCVLSMVLNSMPMTAANLDREAVPADRQLQLGLLDVTQPPYMADLTGNADCTKAIQQAVNDARDRGLVCFFPGGTYLLSDTISCEQFVRKLDRPKHVDGGTQHYWPVYRPMVLLGSTKGKRPVLKLATNAKGFDDPARPKNLIWIWAQTWFDAIGKEEPVWGKEQANISFNQIFRGHRHRRARPPRCDGHSPLRFARLLDAGRHGARRRRVCRAQLLPGPGRRHTQRRGHRRSVWNRHRARQPVPIVKRVCVPRTNEGVGSVCQRWFPGADAVGRLPTRTLRATPPST